MKSRKILLLIGLVFLLTAFTPEPPEPPAINAGTYSSGSCGGKKIELTINPDQTFRYFNNTNPDKMVDIHGVLIRKGKTLHFSGHYSAFSIHDKWRIDENGQCLKSRNGLNFTRLCLN